MVVEMVDKKGPHFPDPLRSPDDKQYAEVLQRQVDVTKELDYVYKAITLTRKKLQGRVPLIGFCGAPWTLLCYMVEGGGTKMFKESKTWIYKYPEQSKLLLQKIAELCVDHLAHQVEAGAQVCPKEISRRVHVTLELTSWCSLYKFSTHGRVSSLQQPSRNSPRHTCDT